MLTASLSIEITNYCNRNCLHCCREKLKSRGHLPFALFERILDQALDCKIKYVCLTGGEPTMHPDFEKIITTLAQKKCDFSIISNGRAFGKEILPLLCKPNIQQYLDCIAFSIDGAHKESHDTLRGDGSFQEVMTAIELCQSNKIPYGTKTVITNLNKKEIGEIILNTSSQECILHSFISLMPTPLAVEKNIIPSKEELAEIYSFIMEKLIPTISTRISLEGSTWENDSSSIFLCNAFQLSFDVDHLGNLIFCCNLSDIRSNEAERKEYLVDLKHESLKIGIEKHFRLLAEFLKSALNESKRELNCQWCYKYFDIMQGYNARLIIDG